MRLPEVKPSNLIYPETDDEPIAEDTLQFHWLTKIEGGLQALFQERPDVFVAADLFWYPVEGNPYLRTSPDVMVALGRPKGHRRSYLQWEEGGHPPDVVFEILAVGRRKRIMVEKLRLYERYGVEEYYIYDPTQIDGQALIREDGKLRAVPQLHGWTSPKLGIRFDLSGPELVIIRPDGQPMLSRLETLREIKRIEEDIVRLKRETEVMKAESARMETEIATMLTLIPEAESARARELLDRLAATPGAAGVDPDSFTPRRPSS